MLMFKVSVYEMELGFSKGPQKIEEQFFRTMNKAKDFTDSVNEAYSFVSAGQKIIRYAKNPVKYRLPEQAAAMALEIIAEEAA